MANKRNGALIYALLLTTALGFRVAVAKLLPNDQPFDGKVYSQIARNLLEQHVYSHATEPPYSPTLIRLPGYPFFLADVYSVFGHHADSAIRIVQALIDTAACGLIGLVAFYWEPDPKLKRRSSIAALALAAFCPFTTIYVATILTETATIFFAVAMCLTATLAFRATTLRQALWLWVATGLVAGIAVLFRPDSGLFAAAIGITLVITALTRSSEQKSSKGRDVWHRLSRASFLGAVFSLVFCLVLMPWTIRNFRVFHLFQPLAPAHAEMPGEFVPRGYLSWLRTWIDDERYVEPVLWTLDESPISLEEFPEQAFDSAEEKERVLALLEKYNHPPDEQTLTAVPAGSQDANIPPEDQPTQSEESESDQTEDEPTADDQSDESDQVDETPASENVLDQWVEMTSDIDAGFARIANERITRHPLRYFILLPVKRALSLWFDTHSQYYPFEGELLPLADLDYDIHQQIWLPLFASLTFFYTVLGVAGGWFLWRDKRYPMARTCLLLAATMIFLRLAFFSTLENPEPRYVVELFPLFSILGGIAVTRIINHRGFVKPAFFLIGFVRPRRD
jgi:dolichyl-phosphate-mannose-protein mannosyltransferase